MIEELWSSLIGFTEQFVVPDWGALVGLIPVGLALIVFMYLVWLILRYAGAGPRRRGKRRMTPVTPKGIHMPGPSLAPLLAATGAFFMVFGMVAGGIWLWVGAGVLVLALLFWGREEMRNYDRMPGAATAGGAPVGALPAPRGTPPAGVHIPPPSFRPLLIAIGFTALVAGMVIGGVALVLGAIAMVLVLLGWLWDARREYNAVEDADQTGHLDMGGAPAWPKATLGILALLVVLAAVFGTGIIQVTPDTGETPAASAAPGGSVAPGGSTAPGGGTTASEAPPAAPDADVVVTAKGINWVESAITIPAGAPFTLALDNQDAGIPHDVVIRDAGGAEVFRTDLVTGVAVVVYDVPAIPAGQYTFVCTVHPNMTGTVTAQ
jgi:plastocyanin